MSDTRDRRARAYLRSRRAFDSGLSVVRACFDGLWLGLLDGEQLHEIDQRYYDGQRQYADPSYNQRGLWPWERSTLDTYFGSCHRIAVLGAGGGREVAALLREGFDVDGFECNEALVTRGNELLRSLDLPPKLAPMPRDRWPAPVGRYDGVIIGWGTYMLIADRRDRIALLRAAGSVLPDGGPILVSFFARTGTPRYFRIVTRLANIVRRARRRELVELGASLAPNLVHFFTLDQIAQELREGGFSPALTRTDDYGHAVGLAAHVDVPARAPDPPASGRRPSNQAVSAG